MAGKPFYITTTIPYVNADPHIGFALEIVQADSIARYQRLMGREVFFSSGADEHGQKIAQKESTLDYSIPPPIDESLDGLQLEGRKNKKRFPHY